MKYLFVINSLLAGGAERSLLDLVPRLLEQRITPVIACLRHARVGFEEEARSSGFDVRYLAGNNRLGHILAVRKLIKEERPNLVYTSLFDADLTGRLAALGSDVPVISNLANTSYDAVRLQDPSISLWRLRVVKWIDGFTARHLTDHFHAVSQAAKDSAIANLRVPAERITVAKRGRDEARLGARTAERRGDARASLGLASDAEVIVAVGRQEYQKGHTSLVEAFATVQAVRPRTRLLIAGREGHVSTRLRMLIEELSLGSTVSLLGHRDDIGDILSAADLFIFPSIYEGLGGALIEALAMGLPAVVTDIPSLREVVKVGENADMVKPGDHQALSVAILGLLDDDSRRLRYGQRSRALFEAEFRAENAIEPLLALLKDVAGQASSR